jgi:hypothetical protein
MLYGLKLPENTSSFAAHSILQHRCAVRNFIRTYEYRKIYYQLIWRRILHSHTMTDKLSLEL